MSFSLSETQRLEQLDALYNLSVKDSRPIVLHGSIGHASLTGISLPDINRKNGTFRDIDVFIIPRHTEDTLPLLGELDQEPCPIDSSSCGLLIKDGDDFYARKDSVIVPLDDEGVFDEVVEHEIIGSNGVRTRTFSGVGMMALHRLEPGFPVRLTHPIKDTQLLTFARKHNLVIPEKTQLSIDRFHQEYNKRYPYGRVLTQASKAYTSLLPESIRKIPRNATHRFMLKHAGRQTPYSP